MFPSLHPFLLLPGKFFPSIAWGRRQGAGAGSKALLGYSNSSMPPGPTYSLNEDSCCLQRAQAGAALRGDRLSRFLGLTQECGLRCQIANSITISYSAFGNCARPSVPMGSSASRSQTTPADPGIKRWAYFLFVLCILILCGTN